MKKKVTEAVSPVVIRLPKDVISALDREAEKNFRSRSSEIRSRLMKSLAMKGRA